LERLILEDIICIIKGLTNLSPKLIFS
jgi:hypothetical protein